jgi:hypothetical protein
VRGIKIIYDISAQIHACILGAIFAQIGMNSVLNTFKIKTTSLKMEPYLKPTKLETNLPILALKLAQTCLK